MEIWRKILIFIATLIMPLGLFLAIQGGYFYQLTSPESADILVDSFVNNLFLSKSTEFGQACDALNLSCLSLDSTISSICMKSEEIRQSADSEALQLCAEGGFSCKSLENARDIFCETYGESEQICKDFNTNVNSVQSIEKICSDIKGFKNQIEEEKKNAYETEFKTGVGGISLSKLHAGLANSIWIGLAIILITIAIVYIGSGNWFTVLNTIIYTVLSTGVVILMMGVFGYQVVNSLVPSLSNTDFPEVARNMIQGIFDFEFDTGLKLTIAGASAFIIMFIIKKFYLKDKVKIYNMWASSK